MSDDDPLGRLVIAMMASAHEELPAQVYLPGVAALRRYLQRRFSPAINPADLDDLAQDAVLQLLRALRRGLVTPARSPTGYLLAIAVNNARALLGAGRPDVPLDTVTGRALTDDEAAARLDQVATADLVQRAMGCARADGDATAVRVTTYLLDEIQRTGEAPGSRRVAEALGLSHAGVAKALHRMRRHIAQADSD